MGADLARQIFHVNTYSKPLTAKDYSGLTEGLMQRGPVFFDLPAKAAQDFWSRNYSTVVYTFQ